MKTSINIGMMLLFLLSSWTMKEGQPIEKANWLIGTWENKTPRGSVYEAWHVLNKTELSGRSFMVKDQDTMVFEQIRLVQEGDMLVYIPTVEDQNNKQPVRFTQKSVTDSELIFENTNHDFPQVIQYKRISKDSLVAEISGEVRGKMKKQTFPMKRIR